MRTRTTFTTIVLLFSLFMSACSTMTKRERLAIPDKNAKYEEHQLEETSVLRSGDFYRRGEDTYSKSQVTELFKEVSPSAYDMNERAKVLRTISYVALGVMGGSYIYGLLHEDFNRVKVPFFGGMGIMFSTAIWSAFTVQSAAKVYDADLRTRLSR